MSPSHLPHPTREPRPSTPSSCQYSGRAMQSRAGCRYFLSRTPASSRSGSNNAHCSFYSALALPSSQGTSSSGDGGVASATARAARFRRRPRAQHATTPKKQIYSGNTVLCYHLRFLTRWRLEARPTSIHCHSRSRNHILHDDGAAIIFDSGSIN
jgi:hypothetical protein